MRHSRVCRSALKCVEHAASPGPRLKRSAQQKLSDSKLSVVCVVSVLSASVMFYDPLHIFRWGGRKKTSLSCCCIFQIFFGSYAIPYVLLFVCAVCNKMERCIRSRSCVSQELSPHLTDFAGSCCTQLAILTHYIDYYRAMTKTPI